MGVYSRAPLAFERGRGVRLYTAEGEEYLDCLAGIATTGLGHAHIPNWCRRHEGPGRDALARLQHLPHSRPGSPGRAAVRDHRDGRSVLHQLRHRGDRVRPEGRAQISLGQGPGRERIDIIGFDGAFHGRSYAAVFAAGNPAYTEGFGPPLPGYTALAYGDMEALEAAITDQTCAVLIEPVQGEGGARAMPEEPGPPPRLASALHRDRHAPDLRRDPVRPSRAHRQALRPMNGRRDAAPDISHVRGLARRWATASRSAPAWPPPTRRGA